MQTFISILRGINVSGQKKVEMAGLKTLYEELDFQNVQTYIQSGNVIFTTKKNTTAEELVAVLEAAIKERYTFAVPVIVRSLDDWKEVIDQNPFVKEAGVNLEKLHVTFLEKAPETGKLDAIKDIDYSPDRFIVIRNNVYLYCPGSYGETKLSNNFFENKLKVKATTRNWKTVNKLYDLATQL